MALRPLRNATISFGLVSIPVRFYTVTKSEDIHFNLLHESCGTRVNRKWWRPHHEEIVSSDESHPRLCGHQSSARLSSVSSLLATAMKKENKVAVARWVAGGKEHLVVVRPNDKGLILHTMYYADEVRDFGAIDIEDAPVREKEIQLAEMLIAELTEKKFNPLAYKDEYRKRLLDRITDKARGKTIVAEEKEEEKGGEVVDIMEALRRSLKKGTRRAPKPAARKRKAAASKKKKAS